MNIFNRVIQVIPENLKQQAYTFLGGAVVTVVGAITYNVYKSKQHKHEKEEAYKAGSNAQAEKDNRELSRANAHTFTRLHCYAIGKAVCDRHKPKKQPQILIQLALELMHSDLIIVRDLYETKRNERRTVSERIQEYSKFIYDLDLSDRQWSLSEVDRFMEDLVCELGHEVESEWQAFYNHNRQI